MPLRFTKPLYIFFAFLLTLSLTGCGVKTDLKAQHTQEGPHDQYKKNIEETNK